MALKPWARALAAVSAVTTCPSSFWTLVILRWAIWAARLQLSMPFMRRSWNMRGKSTLRRSVPCCWRMLRFTVWALPLIFLPFTVRLGQFLWLPGLKSAGMPRSLSASVMAA